MFSCFFQQELLSGISPIKKTDSPLIVKESLISQYISMTTQRQIFSWRLVGKLF
jgi:hypothetical protein